MPGKDLPITTGPLVQGDGYQGFPVPDNDAADLNGLSSADVSFKSAGTGGGAAGESSSPCDIVSLATKTVDAPGNSQTWSSGDKGTDWMGGSSLPWEK